MISDHVLAQIVTRPPSGLETTPGCSFGWSALPRTYSFIVVPMAHNGRLHGVLSLSNRADAEGFTETDLDRAMLAASVFAVTLGSRRANRRADVWA